MKVTPGGILSSIPGWIDEVARINRDVDGYKKPLLAKQESRRKTAPGETFKFNELPGNGQVMMAALISADVRGTQVPVNEELEARLKEATAGMNWTTSIPALADYALDRLEGQEIWFYGRGRDVTEGPLVKHETRAIRGKKTRVRMEGYLPPVETKDNSGKSKRKRISIPLDVRRRIHEVTDEESGAPFTQVLLALAIWALDDLKKRKKLLVVQANKNE